jgi:hypothetical protein
MCTSSFFDLDPRYGWVVNATTSPPYSWERSGNHCVLGWMGHRFGLDGCGNCRPHSDSFLDPSSPYCYPVLLRNAHIPFSQLFQNKTKKTHSPWRGRQHVPPKHQNKPFIKSNVRSRRDLDPCCAFGCSQVQISTPKPAILISVYS